VTVDPPAPPPPGKPPDEPPPATPPAPPNVFPPPPFAPPAERTARPDDGVWLPYVPAGVGEPALLYRTTVHPDAVKRHVVVTVVAIDLQRVALRLVAGTLEPTSDSVPKEHRPGIVAPADLPELIAVLNGGFMTHHGGWGMGVGAETLAPPKPEGCTVALHDGAVEVRTWSNLPSSHASPGATPLTSFRQTPPCLVERGDLQAALLGPEKPRAWGLSETGSVDIRRSALGVSQDGRTLFYGLGEEITPRALAGAMKAAGAFDAAELDVNWSYTRFLVYAPPTSPGAIPEVRATLIPKIKHAPRQYVAKPSERDFFYLVRRR
jgi:hypothetical protein